jgi:hypothetical protein
MSDERRGPRLLSYSEIETALTCFAKWDFSYGGRLAGSTLKPKEVIRNLSRGSAWGAAVAAWHANAGTLIAGLEAHRALSVSLAKDAQQMRDAGIMVVPGYVAEMQAELAETLDWHMATVPALPNLTRLEDELIVPIPSRNGGRGSNRYKFLARLDGFTDLDDDGDWIVEFKLRANLTPFEVAQLSPQLKEYAWAYQTLTGRKVRGVLLDETLSRPPEAPRIVNGTKKDTKTPSHARDQWTTPERYAATCVAWGVEPKLDTLAALGERRWHVRHPVVYTQDEIETTGHELVAAAKLIRDLDSGELHPIRNASKMRCNYCKFKAICPHPEDTLYVESLFTRTVPKRLRGPYQKQDQKEIVSA